MECMPTLGSQVYGRTMFVLYYLNCLFIHIYSACALFYNKKSSPHPPALVPNAHHRTFSDGEVDDEQIAGPSSQLGNIQLKIIN